MRVFLIVLVLLQGVLVAGELEIRSYRVGKPVFMSVYRENGEFKGEPDPFDTGAENFESVEIGRKIDRAPFKSRFLKEGDSLWDCSKGMGILLGEKEWKGMAVIDEEEGELVVKADVRDHLEIAEVFEDSLGFQIETEVKLYTVPGVGVASTLRSVDEIEKGGKLLGVMSCVHLPGQEFEARTKDGDFVIQGESQWDSDIVESRISLISTIEGGVCEWKTGLVTERGMPSVVEVGSMDGKRALVVVLQQSRILFDGGRLDDWILKEEEGAFLREERLTGVGKFKFLESDEVRLYCVPPSLLDLLSTSGGGVGDEDDPFAVDTVPRPKMRKADLIYQGSHPELAKFRNLTLYDVTNLFRENGVSFRPGDFAVFSKRTSTLAVKVSKGNLDLVEGIRCTTGPNLPRMVRLGIARVEAVEKIDRVGLRTGRYELKEKIGMVVLPGLTGTTRIGKELVAEAETQIDWRDELIEISVSLAERGDLKMASFKTQVVLKKGESAVIQQVRKDGRWEAWVLTAEVVELGVEK